MRNKWNKPEIIVAIIIGVATALVAIIIGALQIRATYSTASNTTTTTENSTTTTLQPLPATQKSNTKPLLDGVTIDSYEGGARIDTDSPVAIGDTRYHQGILMEYTGFAKFDLNRLFKTVTFTTGIPGDWRTEPQGVKLFVYCDGKEVDNREIADHRTSSFKINTVNVKQLIIENKKDTKRLNYENPVAIVNIIGNK